MKYYPITLTVHEIMDLAEFAGLGIVFTSRPTGDELETEITVDVSPTGGMTDDVGNVFACKHIAWYTDLPNEGRYPLGRQGVRPA